MVRELAPAWTMAARAQAASPWPVSYGVWVVAALMAFYVRYNGSSADTGGGITIDGASFPSELKMGGISQQLTGGGTRTKYGVAKVYAVALYVDTAAASSSLKKFASPKPIKDQKFFQALVDGTYSRTLFLQMLRGVASDAMVSALEEALSKRLSSAVLAKFREALLKALPSTSLAKGDKLYFQCKGGVMSIGEGSPSAGATIKDKAVCPAFFDVYFGKSPVSPAAKDGVAAGFASRGFYQ